MNNPVHTKFYKAPVKLFSLGLNTSEFTVLAYLISISNNEKVYPSIKTIADSVNLSSKTVNRIIKSLKKRNLLEYDRGGVFNGQNISNHYRVIFEKIDPECVVKSLKQVEEEKQNETQSDNIIKKTFEEYLS